MCLFEFPFRAENQKTNMTFEFLVHTEKQTIALYVFFLLFVGYNGIIKWWDDTWTPGLGIFPVWWFYDLVSILNYWRDGRKESLSVNRIWFSFLSFCFLKHIWWIFMSIPNLSRFQGTNLCCENHFYKNSPGRLFFFLGGGGSQSSKITNEALLFHLSFMMGAFL